MSIFGAIIQKIVHAAEAIEGGHSLTTAVPPTAAAAQQPQAIPQVASAALQGGAAQEAAPLAQVDIRAVLSSLAEKSGETLNWETSIVDLLKLLGLDSSHESRKELAKELNYPGDVGDSAAMNVWLQKQVMDKLAENGGKVPDSLRAA